MLKKMLAYATIAAVFAAGWLYLIHAVAVWFCNGSLQ